MENVNTASSARHRLSYVKEVSYGVTPTAPQWKPFRNTATSLAMTKETMQSEESREDRQIADFKHGNQQVGGDVSIEFSYASFDDMLEAALCGTWTNNVLNVGVAEHSFSIERFFSDVAQYHRFTGVHVNTLSLSIAPNAMVTGSFGLIGKGMFTTNQNLEGSTYDKKTLSTPFDSFSGGLLINGVKSNLVTEASISLENGFKTKFVVGSSETIKPSVGRSNVSGSLTVYFQDSTMINHFINEDEISLTLTLDSRLGSYQMELPRVKFGGGQPDTSGEEDVMLSMDFQALPDKNGVNFRIVRRPVGGEPAKANVAPPSATIIV